MGAQARGGHRHFILAGRHGCYTAACTGPLLQQETAPWVQSARFGTRLSTLALLNHRVSAWVSRCLKKAFVPKSLQRAFFPAM